MPEGDSVRQTAARLRVLEGEVVAVEAPHPRAAALGIAPRLDGRRLERVEAVGKNLLLTFEDGVVLRSHLRMRGRWRVDPVGAERKGTPWLVLRGGHHEAVLWNGPVLELGRSAVDRLGPDILADPPDLGGMLCRLRRSDQSRTVADALLDQRLLAGVGNMWRAEVLFLAGEPPRTPLSKLDDGAILRILEIAAEAMKAGRTEHLVYRRAGLPCRRCGTLIRAERLGEGARTVYWCPACQAGRVTTGA